MSESILPQGVTVYQTDIDTYVYAHGERVLIHAEHFPIPGCGWTVHAIDADGNQSKHHVDEGCMDAFAAEWCGRVLAVAS